jgi:hypothetical protein
MQKLFNVKAGDTHINYCPKYYILASCCTVLFNNFVG